jgi:hypothetical protein
MDATALAPMHKSPNRGTADRLKPPHAPHTQPATIDPATSEASPTGLSREELRRIVLDLLG